MIDSGISKNASEGKLGRFIDAVENKLIPKDLWLVVTGIDKKIYTKQSVTDNPMELMYSIAQR